VNGGPGGGFFLPCLSEASPFVYGASQQVGMSFYASASAGDSNPGGWDASAGLGGYAGFTFSFLFWDSEGHPLSDASYSLTEIPEPDSFRALGVAFLTLAVARLIGASNWRPVTNCA